MEYMWKSSLWIGIIFQRVTQRARILLTNNIQWIYRMEAAVVSTILLVIILLYILMSLQNETRWIYQDTLWRSFCQGICQKRIAAWDSWEPTFCKEKVSCWSFTPPTGLQTRPNQSSRISYWASNFSSSFPNGQWSKQIILQLSQLLRQFSSWLPGQAKCYNCLLLRGHAGIEVFVWVLIWYS